MCRWEFSIVGVLLMVDMIRSRNFVVFITISVVRLTDSSVPFAVYSFPCNVLPRRYCISCSHDLHTSISKFVDLFLATCKASFYLIVCWAHDFTDLALLSSWMFCSKFRQILRQVLPHYTFKSEILSTILNVYYPVCSRSSGDVLLACILFKHCGHTFPFSPSSWCSGFSLSSIQVWSFQRACVCVLSSIAVFVSLSCLKWIFSMWVER